MKKVKQPKILEDENLRKELVYIAEFEEDFLYSKLPVQSPYVLHDVNGERYILASWQLEKSRELFGKEITKENFKGIVSRYVYPFDEDNLLDDVEKINLKSDDSILWFCNKYGLLGELVNQSPVDRMGKVNFGWKIKMNSQESYRYFHDEISRVQDLIDIYFKWLQSSTDIIEREPEKKESIMELEKDFKRKVNSMIIVYPGFNLETKEGFLPSLSSPTLIGAIYYKLYEVALQGKQFRSCLNCKSLFLPRKSNAKFCPPLYANKRSSCQNSYNQMKSRARKSVKLGKKTIEDVSNSLGRPLEEIRGWFN